MEPIASTSLDVATPHAPLTIRRDDKVVDFNEVVTETITSKSAGYWATQVDVRNVSYTVYGIQSL